MQVLIAHQFTQSQQWGQASYDLQLIDKNGMAIGRSASTAGRNSTAIGSSASVSTDSSTAIMPLSLKGLLLSAIKPLRQIMA